jgi:2-isopropylmalate synthase
MNKVIIFDTTLRDGEQSPGFSMSDREKLTMARQLARLKVDVIEAGFPISSPGDFESVRTIARTVRGPVIAGLARALKKDIERAWEALREAERFRIHTFIATSDIHLKHKLRMSREDALAAAVGAVRLARNLSEDVEFSAEDAGRSDIEYLCRVIEAVIEAGAGTINIPDTVGYAIPDEFGALIAAVVGRVPNIHRATLSVHCHNDLGLGVANSIAAVRNGARQVECTVNGIGERAGNASLEEFVMALQTRHELLGLATGINTREIFPTSELLCSLTGIAVQPNKAIVGRNAFAHEAGIHQDGVLKHKSTYEIMTPESVGLNRSQLVLGKHSGRHAFLTRLGELGYDLDETEAARAFDSFKALADKKKDIFDDDLRALVDEKLSDVPETWVLSYLNFSSGNQTIPTATVELVKDGKKHRDASTGDGPVDSAYKAIERITKVRGKLLTYGIRAITVGKDAIGEATIRVEIDGESFGGKGRSTDIVESSVRAYLQTINKHLARKGAVDEPRTPPPEL